MALRSGLPHHAATKAHARRFAPRRSLARSWSAARSFLAVALLASIGTASTFDGAAADLVGGDDGDVLVARRQEAPALTAAAARPSDIRATPHRAPFAAPVDSAPSSLRPSVAPAPASAPSDLAGVVALPPPPSRAPPAA